jgi:YegS/Rv2252/BmrU family lipid kinase
MEVKEWFFIVNPNAGSRKCEKDWPEILKQTHKKGLDFDFKLTEYRLHATEIAQSAILRGYRKLVVVGGDGTLNEVVNGVLSQKTVSSVDICVGMITVGTGNDWGRMFQIPHDYKEAIDVLIKGDTFLQDGGIVTYQNSHSTKERYFVNIAGIGFDAAVVEQTNHMKDGGSGGTYAYLKSLVTSLIRYKPTRIKIEVDGRKIENDVFSMSVGICKYNGGGMMQLPDAVPNDGLFDITVINKISRGDVILSLPKLYNGKIGSHPKVSTYSGERVLVQSDPPIYLETDGESLGHTPLEFKIIPKSLRMIIGQAPNGV